MIREREKEGETTPQLLARLVAQGGKLMVVGGHLADHLPQQLLEHPALVVWDDQKQACLNKDVPASVKAILWTRWTSHTLAARLNNAVEKMRILKFPMLKTAEVKRLLAEVVQEVGPVAAPPPEPPMLVAVTITDPPAPRARGAVREFVAANWNPQLDYAVLGALSAEARRLHDLARAAVMETTYGSLEQSLRNIVRESGLATHGGRPLIQRPPQATAAAVVVAVPLPAPIETRAEAPQPERRSGDDFDELDRLLSDAITALRLVQEHMPRVKQETERLRGMRDKVLELFADDRRTK